MPRKIFIRRSWNKHSRLGKGRGKKQKWRKPKGRDTPVRTRRRGYQSRVSIGYGNSKEERGKINGKLPIIITNVRELEKIDEKSVGVIASVGKRKKIEIAKKAIEMKKEIINLNLKKFVEKNEKKKEPENKPKENKK